MTARLRQLVCLLVGVYFLSFCVAVWGQDDPRSDSGADVILEEEQIKAKYNLF